MNNPVHRQRIMKCGWLKKQGGMVKTWHRRWFCLNGDCLFYFAKEDDLRPLGSIFLPGNRVSEVPFSPDDADKFLFEIFPGKMQTKMAPNHDSFLLWAATDNERQNWIRAIRKVMFSSFGGAIFGQSLEETMEFEHKKGRNLPHLIELCVEFLKKHGLDTEGIFRLPGRNILIKEIKEKFDCAEKVEFDIADMDVHTVASVLKLYFRELPQSIIPSQYYQKFMNIALHFQGAKDNDDRQRAVDELKEHLQKIPEDNFNILTYLCRFLAKVSDHSDANKMTILNLSTVFGPNMIRNVSEADSAELMMATADITQQLAFMMIHYNTEVFGDKEFEILSRKDSKGEVPVDDLLGLEDGGEFDEGSLLMPMPASASLLQQLSEEFNFFGTENISPTEGNFYRLRNSGNYSEGSSKESSPKPEVPPKPIPPQRSKKMSKIMRNKRLGSEKNRELIVSSASSTTSERNSREIAPQEEHRKMHYLETSFDDYPVNGEETVRNGGEDVDGPLKTATHEEFLEKELLHTKEKYEREIALLNDRITTLELQNKTSAKKFAEVKTKYERQVKDLNKNMSVITSRYENRISALDAVHKDTIKNLEDKLTAEKKSREDAVRRVINLQAELQQYHLHFGEIGN